MAIRLIDINRDTIKTISFINDEILKHAEKIRKAIDYDIVEGDDASENNINRAIFLLLSIIITSFNPKIQSVLKDVIFESITAFLNELD